MQHSTDCSRGSTTRLGRIQPGQVPRPAFVGKKGLVADTAKSRVTWEKYAGDGTEFAELFAVLPIGDGRDTGLTFADAALVTSGSRGCVPAADANAVPSTTHLKCMPRSAEAGQYTAQEAIYKSPGTLEAGVLAKDRGCVFVGALLEPIVKDSHLKLGVNFIHTYEKVTEARATETTGPAGHARLERCSGVSSNQVGAG
jgi:hypothetical protein